MLDCNVALCFTGYKSGRYVVMRRGGNEGRERCGGEGSEK